MAEVWSEIVTDDREFRLAMLGELATVTKNAIAEDALDLYIQALQRQETGTLSEACSRLMQTAKFFPSVAEINETCRIVRAEEERLDASAIYSRKEWLPQTRAELWLDHLKRTLTALQYGLPRPAPPEPINSEGPTFKCYHCEDTGFTRVCTCEKKGCKNCQYHYVQECVCRPPRSAPMQTQIKRYARSR
jgi:hypothetical protein